MRTSPVPAALRLCIATGLALVVTVPTIFAAAVIDLRFNEGSGRVTLNEGTSGGSGIFAEQNGSPAYSTNIPAGPFTPAANISSIDFGLLGGADGNRAIDFPSSTATPTAGVSAFTVTGWINLRTEEIGPGGNRMVSTWPGEFGATRGGFEVVQASDARLRFSVNEAPDFPGPGPFSSFGRVTVDPNTPVENWVFFAITYDAGDLGNSGDGLVNFYFGNGSTPAALDTVASYDRGSILAVAPGKTGALTVGNFTPDVDARPQTGTGSRVLRGLVDEVHFYDAVLSETEIQAVQTIPEPATALLLVTGLVGFAAKRRRREYH